jgi:ADP-ribose pyrophosphatase
MVRQYRHPVRSTTWEIPAGKLDPNESPLPCARRELEEETGFKAGRLRRLLSYWPTGAFSDEIIHIFGAWDLAPGKLNPDEDEFIASREIDLKTALRWIRTGKIKDSKTIIALLYVGLTSL